MKIRHETMVVEFEDADEFYKWKDNFAALGWIYKGHCLLGKCIQGTFVRSYEGGE